MEYPIMLKVITNPGAAKYYGEKIKEFFSELGFECYADFDQEGFTPYSSCGFRISEPPCDNKEDK